MEELAALVELLVKLIGIAGLVLELKKILRELEGGPGIEADSERCVGEIWDLDAMEDLDEGSPYIWNRRG